ncbi:MAG: RDD family protein [Pseudomonadota bacterium]
MDREDYAGFWIRLGATLIDTLVFMLVFSIPLTLIYGVDYWQSEAMSNGFWDVLLTYVAPIALTIWFWVRYLGTPGKMMLGLSVVDADTGGPISIPKAVGRYLGYFVSTIPFLLGFVWIGFDKRKQGFHDKLAGTVVVRGRPGDGP